MLRDGKRTITVRQISIGTFQSEVAIGRVHRAGPIASGAAACTTNVYSVLCASIFAPLTAETVIVCAPGRAYDH